MPWADVRLNTDANFETAEVKEKEGEENRVPIPPFGWYRWANDNEEETPKREGNKLRLPPIKDGRKISYISFVITEEEMEEKEKETKDEKEKGEKIENGEKRTKEDNEEDECDEDIFSRSLAPTTFRLALASLPQGIEQTGRESRSERMKKISYISEIFAFHTIPPAGPPPEVEQKKGSFVDGKTKDGKSGMRVSWKQILLPCWYVF